MEIKDFKRGPDGQVELNPLVGWTTATLPDDMRFLRIEYTILPEDPEDEPEMLQLVMPVDQTRELGEALLKLADAPHIEYPPRDSQH